MGELVALAGAISGVIGLFDPLANRLTEFANRYRSFREQLQAFDGLATHFSNIKIRLDTVDTLLSNARGRLGEAVYKIFRTSFDDIIGKVKDVNETVAELSNLFDKERTNPKSTKLINKAHRFFRADKVTKKIDVIVNTLKDAAAIVLKLTTPLSLLDQIITSEERLVASFQSMHPVRQRSEFTSIRFVPILQRHVCSRFTVKDDAKPPETQEDLIKISVYKMRFRTQSQVSAIVGVSGMGGIGKTTALIALGWDGDVCEWFPDGIYFMKLGKDSDFQRFRSRLSDIVLKTGGHHEATEISQAASPVEAAQLASVWLKDCTVLFLCDDLWDTKASPFGFVDELKILLQNAKNSSLIISTSDRNIAKRAGTPIEFHPRDRLGTDARDILIKAASTFVGATFTSTLGQSEHDSAISRITDRCAGVPLTLAASGRAIADLCELSFGSWTVALQKYEAAFENKSQTLLRRLVEGYPDNFESTIRKQTTVSNSTLLHLWDGLQTEAASRATTKMVHLNILEQVSDGGINVGVSLHDHVLDFCEEEAKRLGLLEQCHRQLLHSYIPSKNTSGSDNNDNLRDINTSLLGQVTRPWWDKSMEMERDNFLFDNLIGLLVGGGLIKEAVGVLSDARWTLLRYQSADIVAILRDFERMMNALATRSTAPHVSVVTRGLVVLRDATSDMDIILRGSISEFVPQAHARLIGLNDESGLFRRFLLTSQNAEPAVWLRALHRQWPGPYGARSVQIPVKHFASYISVDWKQRKILVAGDMSISEVDIQARNVIRRLDLEGEIIAISADSAMVAVRSSDDANVVVFNSCNVKRVWEALKIMNRDTGAPASEIEKSQTTVGSIRMALWSADGSVLVVAGTFSGGFEVEDWWIVCLDGTSGQKIWGKQTLHRCNMLAMAASADGGRIVVGFLDGSVKIWDGSSGEEIWYNRGVNAYGVRAVAMRSDGALFVTADYNRMVRIWTTSGDSLDFSLHLEVEIPFEVWHLAISAEGSRVICCNQFGELQVRDVGTSQVVFDARASGTFVQVAASPDGQFVAAAGQLNHGGTVWAWDTAVDTEPGHQASSHSGRVRSVTFGNGGSQVLSVGGDELKTWETNTGTILKSHALPEGSMGRSLLPACSSDGKVAMTDGEYVSWVDWRSNEMVREDAKAHNGNLVVAVSVSTDGRYTGTFGHDNMVKLWERPGVLIASGSTQIGISYLVSRLAFSGDLQRMAISSGNCMQFLKGPLLTPSDTIECESIIFSLSMSTNSDLVTSGHNDGSIQIWNCSSAQCIWHKTRAHDRRVSGVSMRHDGHTVVSTGFDSKLKVWDNAKSINYLKNDAAGKAGALTVTADSVTRTNVKNREDANSAAVTFNQVAEITLRDEPRCVALYTGDHPDGKERVAAGNLEGNVVIFEVERK